MRNLKIEEGKKYVLHKNVFFKPVKEIDAETTERFSHEETDIIITKKGGRSSSKLISNNIAAFLKHFKLPNYFAKAVADFSKDSGLDPYSFMEKSYPIVTDLLRHSFLHEEGCNDKSDINFSYNVDDLINEEYVIVDKIQAYEDTEIYKVKTLYENGDYILKISRVKGSLLKNQLQQEIKIYSNLTSHYIPKLHSKSRFEDKEYFVIDYIEGLVSKELFKSYHLYNETSVKQLLHIALNILDAYIDIHEKGIVHGDVHSKNILIVPATFEVKLIDFGCARNLKDPNDNPTRAGVIYYHEPELAYAMLNNDNNPPVSLKGEQYALAVLLYELLTDEFPMKFPLEKSKILKSIYEDVPNPISNHLFDAPYEIDSIFSQALSKVPKERYKNVKEFREALYKVYKKLELLTNENLTKGINLNEIQNALKLYSTPISGIEIKGAHNEYISFAQGTTGVAFFFLKLAELYDKPEYLSLAYIWSLQSFQKKYNAKYLELSTKTLIPTSLHYGVAGIFLTHAMICFAINDLNEANQVLKIFSKLHNVQYPDRKSFYDFNYGEIGILHGYTYLLENSVVLDTLNIQKKATDLYDNLLQRAKSSFITPLEKNFQFTGIAHGWAGFIYVLLRWNRYNKKNPDNWIKESLDRLLLVGKQEYPGRIKWPMRKPHAPGYISQKYNFGPLWCNGNSGMIYLLCLAYEVFNDSKYMDLAIKTAEYILNEKPLEIYDLCCGLTGTVYSVNHLYKYTNNEKYKAFCYASIQTIQQKLFVLDPYGVIKGRIGPLFLLHQASQDISKIKLPLFE